MSNKTCGECKHYKPYNEKICLYVHRTCVPPKTKACSSFAKATNGDVIRRMSNEEFRDWYCEQIGMAVELMVESMDAQYRRNVLAWLNAPAESEVNNG